MNTQQGNFLLGVVLFFLALVTAADVFAVRYALFYVANNVLHSLQFNFLSNLHLLPSKTYYHGKSIVNF